jgi:hypothetical protein
MRNSLATFGLKEIEEKLGKLLTSALLWFMLVDATRL